MTPPGRPPPGVFDDNGTYPIGLEVTDSFGATDTATATATVTNVAPTATFDAPETVTAGDDIELALTDPSDPSPVDTTVGFTYAFDCGDGTGLGPYTPTPTATCATDTAWTRTVQARIRDKDNDTTTYTATVNVIPANDPPTAGDDSYTTAEDVVLYVPAPGLLANDVDPDGETLRIIYVPSDRPSHGSAVIGIDDGDFYYRPDADFFGTDSFTYRVSDGTIISEPATVTITVTAVNDAPVANPDSYTTDEDVPLNISPRSGGMLLNDTDAEGDRFALWPETYPSHGTWRPAGNGRLVYTPDPGWSGTDTFSYFIVENRGDRLKSQPTTVTIEVRPIDDPPTAGDDSYTTAEDVVLYVPAPGLLANDVDPDGETLRIIYVPSDRPSHGSAVIGIDDGDFYYRPDADFFGTDSFTYRVSDGTIISEPATVTITVTAVNDAPVANPDSYTTDEDVPLNISPRSGGMLLNDTDAEGDRFALWPETYPSHGTWRPAGNGRLVYTPDPGWSGTDTFSYFIVENRGDRLKSQPTTVTIEVRPIDDPPTAGDDSYTTAEDVVLYVPAPGLLANDVDPDGETLRIIYVPSDRPSHGSAVIGIDDGDFYYRPDADFFGTDSFTYRVSDGTIISEPATVTITVTAVNDAPVANPDSYTTDEDVPLNISPRSGGMLLNDTDAEGDRFALWPETYPSHGTWRPAGNGRLVYTPDPGWSGTDTFSYFIVENRGDRLKSQPTTVTIEVRPIDDPPTAGDDSYTTAEDVVLYVPAPGLLANDVDPHRRF